MRRFLSLPIEWFVLLIPLVITINGIITIYTISYQDHQSSLALTQGVYALIGMVVMLVMMFSDYRFLASISRILFVIGIILLVPLIPFLAPKLPFVLKIYGAYRWINLGFFQLQPAEVFKLIAAIFASAWLAPQLNLFRWKGAVIYLLLCLIPLGLILLQPDLGTAMVVLIVFTAIFLTAKPPIRVVLPIIALLLISAPIAWHNLKPYQKSRIEIFINPSSDPQGEGYNVRQSLIAVGSGGLLGRGFGQGSQTVLNFLPVAHTDFIFAGFAEATGFIGSIVLLLLYTLLIARIVVIARESTDRFGTLLAFAIAIKLMFQVLVNVGMNLGLLPVTGIPLPFMSYGGTALIIDFLSIGILESIYIRHKKIVFH